MDRVREGANAGTNMWIEVAALVAARIVMSKWYIRRRVVEREVARTRALKPARSRVMPDAMEWRRHGSPQTAYHEAGHAFVAYAFGWRCDLASVKAEGESLGRVVRTRVWTASLWRLLSGPSHQRQRELAGSAMISLAGVTAEAIRDQTDVWRYVRPSRFWATPDFRMASENLQRLSFMHRGQALGDAGRKNAIYCGLRLTQRLLEPNRAVLYVLANELLERETLGRRQIEALIRRHPPRLDAARAIDPSRFFVPCCSL